MKQEGDGKRVQIYLSEGDLWHGKSLSASIIERCRAERMSGATVVRGLEGFGADSEIHKAQWSLLNSQLPVIIEIVDTPERIERLLPLLSEMIGEHTVVVNDVHMIKYRKSEPSPNHAR